MARLTQRLVNAAASGSASTIIWDEDVKGFGLRVTAGGHRSYVFQYRIGGRGAPSRRVTIGTHGSPWTPDTARREAISLLTKVRQGQDPMAMLKTMREEALTQSIEAYVDAFVDRYLKANWVRSWREGERVLRAYVVPEWKGKVLRKITRRDVTALMDSLSDRPATARLTFATLRKMFRWAVGRGDLDASPVTDLSSPTQVKSRDRVLSDAEVGAIWRASGGIGFPFGPITQLLMVTAARREEVAAMRWSELEGDLWVLPADRAKNGLQHRVPLSPLALAILEGLPRGTSDLVFTSTGKTAPSGFSKAKARLDTLLAADPIVVAEGLFQTPFRTHDIRRTVATGLQRLGVRFEVTEAVLNHVSGARSGVAGIYQRHEWTSEKRDALGDWSRHLASLGAAAAPSWRSATVTDR